ncbi:MAG TPA: hypothetical protein VH478_24780 [Trebonia sp.]|jgi:predicted RNase H-like HicB family nuclease|nr:hypothetical protein [Trebonia sp.]
METTTFTALAERAGRWWTVRVPQIEGLAVQVRSLEQAEMMARKHIAEVLRVPPESVRVQIRTEGSMLPAVTAALQARQAAIRAAEAAAQAIATALGALLAEGTTLPEAAVVLGLSPEELAEYAPDFYSAPVPPGGSGGHPVSGSGGHPVLGGEGGYGGGVSSPGQGGGSRGAQGHGSGERAMTPSGLPQRNRSSGPMAVHH